MNLRQAAQQALEALEECAVTIDWEWGDCRELEEMRQTGKYTDETTPAITNLRAALAEPEQAEQEPDGISWLKRDSGYFTAPTPRKPLTDEEIGKIAGDCLDAWSCARAIERAHGIGGGE